MFAAFSKALGSLFSPAHYDEREAYLASSSDLVDLERRMRHLDRGDYPFSLHSQRYAARQRTVNDQRTNSVADIRGPQFACCESRQSTSAKQTCVGKPHQE
ncbi:DUF3563 family protein [Paraburkholderia sediminicola]|uniref:DUF3563 family protein n=1 Tax=Paraburkholderia sediminicola TaxID=458836 RepID=UPI0038BCE0F6